MKIVKSIVFFDLETTGTSTSKDRIVQIAAIKLSPDGSRETKEMFINPEMPIPAGATEVHGITDDMVKDAPKFSQIAKGLVGWLFGCDLGGFNSDNFDIPLLMEEFHRVGIEFPTWELCFVDVLKNERRKSPNKLGDVYRRYTGTELENAHDALADISATIEVAMLQCADEPELTPQDIDKLCQGDKERFDYAAKTYVKDGVVYWAFGKNMDKAVLSDLPYLQWVLNADFPMQTKKALKELLTKK
jgi:DNA polymerase-3 subunit epsilon